MTVQELINNLNKISNKNMDVTINTDGLNIEIDHLQRTCGTDGKPFLIIHATKQNY